MSRAQLIRAAIDAVAATEVHLTSASTDRHLKTAVLARLVRNRPGSPGL